MLYLCSVSDSCRSTRFRPLRKFRRYFAQLLWSRALLRQLQTITARAHNAHDRRGEVYAVVPVAGARFLQTGPLGSTALPLWTGRLVPLTYCSTTTDFPLGRPQDTYL